MRTKLKASEAWITALQSGLGSIAVASDLWNGNPPSQLSGGEAALAVADAAPAEVGGMPLKAGMLPRLRLGEGEFKEPTPAQQEQILREKRLLSDMGHMPGSLTPRGCGSPRGETGGSPTKTPRGSPKQALILAERRSLEALALREIGSSSPRRAEVVLGERQDRMHGGAYPTGTPETGSISPKRDSPSEPRSPGVPQLQKPEPGAKQHTGSGSNFWAQHFGSP